MTKIITNKNQEIDIKYYEIEEYCKNEISNNKENIEDFNNFKKDYNYFNPCFDYIFHNKKYILYDPLLIKNTKLYNENRYYYIIEDNMQVTNKNFYDFTLMNDTCVSIIKNPYEIYEGFFILDDGTILTNNFVERHLRSAKLILNNYLINSLLVYKKYLNFIKKNEKYFQYHIIDFLTEDLGIIHGKKYSHNIDLIINSLIITDNQLNTIKRLKKYYKVNYEDCNNYNKVDKLTYKNK